MAVGNETATPNQYGLIEDVWHPPLLLSGALELPAKGCGWNNLMACPKAGGTLDTENLAYYHTGPRYCGVMTGVYGNYGAANSAWISVSSRRW